MAKKETVFVNNLDHYLAYLAGLSNDYPDPTSYLEERLYAICKNGGGGGGGATTASMVSYLNEAVGDDVANVQEALDKIIDKIYYVKPSITKFNATPAPGVFEIGTVINSITFDWGFNKAITSQSLTDCSVSGIVARTAVYNTPLSSNKTFTLTCSDGTNNASASKTYTFVNATYYGVMSSGSVTPVSILDNCTKEVRTKSDITKKFTCNKQSVVFASPWKLKSIINQNNYEVISAFVESTMMINGTTYYVYELANVTINNFAYSFKY